MNRMQQVVEEEKVKTLTLTISAQRRVVLAAVAYGAFERDVESFVAIESAGITLVGGDLGGVVVARRLSQKTMRIIRQNLFFAFAYNIIGLPIAAGVLFPLFGILLSPMLAAAAMSCSSVSVIANSLRLRSTSLSRSTLSSPSSPRE